MFTHLRDIVDTITNRIDDIKDLLNTKSNSLIREIETCSAEDYFSLLQISDLFIMIFKEIENVIIILSKLDTILQFVDTHLHDLIDRVPHYDEVTVLPDTEDEEDDEENFEPYSQVYLDNLLMKVTDEELEYFTSDNGKIVKACRIFIPPSAMYLNTLLTTLTQLEMVLDNNDFNQHSLYQCNGNLNLFNTHFTTYIDQITI